MYRYRHDAVLEAVARADQPTEDGYWEGANHRHRILDCIERIQAQKREQGEAVGAGREDDADSKIAPPGGAGLLSVLGISVTIGESPRSAPYKGHRSQYGA